MNKLLFIFLLACGGGGGGGGGGSSSSGFSQSSSPSSWSTNVLPLSFSFATGFIDEFGDMDFTVGVIETAWATRVLSIDPILEYDPTVKVHPNSNTRSDYYSTPPASIGIYHVNNTQWNAMGYPNDALAVTIYTLSGGAMTKAGILLNDGFNYNFSSTNVIASLAHYDLPTILAHEMGHVLGLSHVGSSQDEENINIMKASLGAGEVRRLAQAEEIAELNELYPSALEAEIEPEENKHPEEKEDASNEEIEGWIALMPDGTCIHSSDVKH